MERRARFQEEPPRKEEEKRREKKPKVGRLLRRKPLKSVGSFVNRIIRTLGTFTHFGDAEPEDDDGGFRAGAPCALSSGVLKEERPEESRGSSSTCREKLLYQYGDRVPGVLGLKNHGNTCFMNAVVQCLSNTDLLAEYLGLDWYKLDLKNVKGEVTEHLASLVRALWTLEYTPQLSVDFKAVVSKYGSQFRGNSQHDALEFLLWLLDRVHEDVSLATHNNNNMLGPPVTVLDGAVEVQDTDLSQAHQPYIQHSFVQEHFQAQYKSSLTCPHCLKQSNTFDPFLCISLPLPLRQTRPLCVVLVFSTKGQRYQRVGFAVTLFGSVAGLRRMVADEGKLSPDQVILTEVYSSGFQRSFSDEDDLSAIGDGDTVYAFQAPPLYVRACSARLSGFHHSLPSSPYSGPEGQRLNACGTLSSEFLNHAVPMKVLLLVCNAAGAGQQAVRFGPPFLMREDRCVSWDQLQQSVLSKLYYLMINGAQAQNTRVLFYVRVVGGSVFYSYLSPADPRPLHHPAVDRALKLCGSGGPPHVKLIIEWDHRIKDCLFGNIQEEVVKDAESVKNQQQQHVQQYSCTLDECFQLYTKEEQLAPDDAWKCPHCKQLQQGVVKMSLWTLPDILILHLKRFRQVGERRNKLTTFVQFPLTDLDMAPHMVNRNHGAHQHPLQAELVPPDFLYDLYAVCNHHGGMHGGHYTASCRNSVDSQWYSYDDSSTEPVPEEDVCTRGAYILFYQRRNSIPPWSAGSSLTGSTSSSTSDHWLVRLSGGSKTGSLMSTGVVSGASQSSQSPELPVFSEDHDGANGFEPFAQRSHGRSNSMRSPMKPKETANKLRWSFGPKDRTKPAAPPQTGELVQYLESGRRPRCTKEPIAALVSSPPLRNPHARGSKVGQDCSSGSGCSPNIPEGQSRVLAEREVRRLVNGSVLDSSPTKVSKSALTVHFSHSAPPSRDSTLARTKVQKGGWTHKDLLHVVLQPDDRRAQRNQEGRSHESLLSLFKSSFLKKDGTRSPVVGQDKRKNGQVASNNSTKVSNGAPTSVVPYERTAHVLPRCDSHDCRVQLANGKAGCLEPVDIKRAHSSSNIQTKMDLTFRRCASLQRNGDMLVHPSHRVLVSDKPGLATLQRTRYSTTSLVPL